MKASIIFINIIFSVLFIFSPDISGTVLVDFGGSEEQNIFELDGWDNRKDRSYLV